MSYITVRQSAHYHSVWVRRNGTHAGAIRQLMLTDDFGNLVAVSHAQFSTSMAPCHG